MTAAIGTLAASNAPPAGIVLLIFGTGVGLALLARRAGAARARRRMEALGIAAAPEPVASRRSPTSRRDARSYAEAIRSQPAFALQCVVFASFALSVWSAQGAAQALMALGISVVAVFPLGFLWWRRWGP